MRARKAIKNLKTMLLLAPSAVLLTRGPTRAAEPVPPPPPVPAPAALTGPSTPRPPSHTLTSSQTHTLTVPPSSPPLPAGVDLLPLDPTGAFGLTRPQPADAAMAMAPVTGQPFQTALQIKIKRQPPRTWDIQITAPTLAPVAKGDAILATFSMRCVPPSSEADASVIFEEAGGSFQKSVEYPVSAGDAWERFQIPFTSTGDYPAGGAHLAFRLGFQPQTIEFGGISLVDFGKAVPLSALPATPQTYPGMEPDAAWRQAAADRIEKYRKGDLAVVVRDGEGRPVPWALVSVKMIRHAFGFGSAVDENLLLDDTPDAKTYRATFLKMFNKAVLDKGLKWPSWERRPERALQAVTWLRDHHIEVRGHNLVWPDWQWLPRDVRSLQKDPAALRRRVEEHVIQEVTVLRGRLTEWDVLNEPVTSHALMDILGKESMVEWFKLAHAADPAPELFVNDFSILSAGGSDTRRQDALAGIITYLQANGAPLGGIGLQSHFNGRLTSPDRLLQILDRFSKFGLPMESTEFDIDISDETLQAHYMRDFMTLLFSDPAVKGILIWGFWEGRDWLPRAALYRRDWTIKPNGQAWLDLVLHQWWTDTAGETAADGAYRVRGFLGDYEITVRYNGKTRVLHATLPRTGATIVIR